MTKKERATCVVECVDETVQITLPRWEALSVAKAIYAAAEDVGISHMESSRIRSIAEQIVRGTRPNGEPYLRYEAKPERYPYKVDRPPASFRNEFDIDHVLHGSPPYPVLSHRDMREVYPLLEAMTVRGEKLTAAQIADRLHVDERTICRWRKRAREGERK
jgi:hypothetical protein